MDTIFAFPRNSMDARYSGMPLHDLFAAVAMHALLKNGHTVGASSDIAERAYAIADAMLREREAKNYEDEGAA